MELTAPRSTVVFKAAQNIGASHTRRGTDPGGTFLEGVPLEQKMLKGHLPRQTQDGASVWPCRFRAKKEQLNFFKDFDLKANARIWP